MCRMMSHVARWTAAGLVMATAAHGEVVGNVALTSDYVVRGMSYSDNDPAIQGGFDWSHVTGWYASVWGSNYDFGSAAHMELDVLAGLTRVRADGVGWDVGAAYYTYPGASATNFGELYGGITYKALTAKLWYANDYSGTGGDEAYWEGEAKFPIPWSLNLTLHAGYSSFSSRVGLKNYADYKTSLSREYQGLTVDLSLTGTNENQLGHVDDRKLAVTVSKQL